MELKDDPQRIAKLLEYKVLDTPAEKELDDLSRLAGLICNTPISLISLLDGNRQWFKSKHGLGVDETPQKDSFCQYALHQPNEVLEIEDSHADERFKENVLVTGAPHIRFYAGAPLVTEDNYVLGTLCVIGREPKKLTSYQKEALQLLAQKAMDILNAKRVIENQKNSIQHSAEKLKKLTDRSPGVVYQFRMDANENMFFDFMSEGIAKMLPGLTHAQIIENSELAFQAVHPEDLPQLLESIKDSYTSLNLWETEYRVILKDGRVRWHHGKAQPQKKENGIVVWYGGLQDITPRKEYQQTLEEIVDDLTHVLRRPVTSLVSLLNLVEQEEALSEEKLKTYAKHMKGLSEELNEYTMKLNETYVLKRNNFNPVLSSN